MRDEGAEGRGFEFGAGFVVHKVTSNAGSYVAPEAGLLNDPQSGKISEVGTRVASATQMRSAKRSTPASSTTRS